MKLWKVKIKTIYFGYRYYELFVIADSESSMIKIVKKYPTFVKDDYAIIDSYEQVDLNDETTRVLNEKIEF